MIAKATCLVLLMATLLTGCTRRHEFAGTLLDGERSAREIAGVDGARNPFRLSDHRGQYILVNFGYTSCPDVCPLTLAELSEFYRQLEDEDSEFADKVSVVFVSVDPERDVPERLGPYMASFHTDFYGVFIADPTELEVVKSAYGIFAEKVAPADGASANQYLVDHSSGTYVVDPEGSLRLFFSHDTDAADILADMRYLLDRSG